MTKKAKTDETVQDPKPESPLAFTDNLNACDSCSQLTHIVYKDPSGQNRHLCLDCYARLESEREIMNDPNRTF